MCCHWCSGEEFFVPICSRACICYRVDNIGETDYVNFCEDNEITCIMFLLFPYLIQSLFLVAENASLRSRALLYL